MTQEEVFKKYAELTKTPLWQYKSASKETLGRMIDYINERTVLVEELFNVDYIEIKEEPKPKCCGKK